jgi:hypothetical protein
MSVSRRRQLASGNATARTRDYAQLLNWLFCAGNRAMAHAMTFKPPEKFVPISGPAGPFEIAFATATPDRLFGYHYRDTAHDFYFYAEATSLPFWNVKVPYAVTGPARTAVYKVTADQERSIRANIEFFFKTRAGIRPAQELAPGTKVVVNFEWRIVR